MNRDEQIQRNCEQIDELLKQYPNRRISVQRIEEDKCKIKIRGTARIIYIGSTEDTLQELKRLLIPNPELIENNFKRIQEIGKQFPESTIKVERVNNKFCRVNTKLYSMTFELDAFNKNIDEDIEQVKNIYIKEANKTNQSKQ